MDFRLTRRALLATALPGAAWAQTAGLAPDGRTLSWDGLAGNIMLPALPARTLALAPVGGKTVTAVAVTDSGPDSLIELLVLAGHDGTTPRLLAIEVLQWQAPNGRLNRRLIPDGEHNQLIFDSNAALKRSATQWQREVWRDFLTWDGTLLADKPVRPPMAGSIQARMAPYRRATFAWIATPRQTLTLKDIVALGLDARSFDLR